MGFRMIVPKRVRKGKTTNGQEVLRRLEEYLQSAAVTGEPVEILCGFWEDQQNAISYQELRGIVLDSEDGREALKLWMQDYAALVGGSLGHLWEDAVAVGAAGQPVLDGLGFEFHTQKTGILNWIRARGAEFVTASTQIQKDAIAALLTKKMRDSHTVDELARLIRPCIGLTEGQATANARYYDHIVESLKKDHPRMKPESVQKKAREAAQKYAERQHRQRAMTIAQTESAFAYNRGADEGIRQAQEEGLLGATRKRWSSSGDDQVCPMCASLDGTEVAMDADFKIRGRALFPGQHALPPAHPRCACAVEYIEMDDIPKLPYGEETPQAGTEEMAHIGEIEPDKTEEAISYYNTVIRNKEVENAVVIDRGGGVYYAEGGKSGVIAKGTDLVGAVITHNHPQDNGIVSFGKDDFDFLQEYPSIGTLYAVNRQFTYRVEVLNDISGISYSDYYRRAMEDFLRAGKLDEDIQHVVFKILDREGLICYVRKKIYE